jgi:hypothetical protein
LPIGGLLGVVFFLSVSGCGGGGSVSPKPPTGGACTGVALSGVLQDSLTAKPVQEGWATLESGTLVPGTKIYNFATIQQTTTDSSGKFSPCADVVSTPYALLFTALDSAAKAYPPLVAPISKTANLGVIPMGGCREDCGLEGQQQTSLPAAFKGVITSVPVSASGTLLFQYAMNAPDASGNLWNLAMPLLGGGENLGFTTNSVGCVPSTPSCAAYSLSLPSQNAVFSAKAGYSQQAGFAFYSVLASITGAATCTPSSVLVSLQQDGKTPLQGTPGAELTVAPISFVGCH